MSVNTQIHDPKTRETLCCYAIGNGNLGALWQRDGNAGPRRVTKADADALLAKCLPVWGKYRPADTWQIVECSNHFEFQHLSVRDSGKQNI